MHHCVYNKNSNICTVNIICSMPTPEWNLVTAPWAVDPHLFWWRRLRAPAWGASGSGFFWRDSSSWRSRTEPAGAAERTTALSYTPSLLTLNPRAPLRNHLVEGLCALPQTEDLLLVCRSVVLRRKLHTRPHQTDRWNTVQDFNLLFNHLYQVHVSCI